MKAIYLFIFVILCSTLATAQPSPIFQSTGSLSIEYSKIQYIPINTNHTFHFHVFNTTNFIDNSSAQCGFTLVQPNGEVVYKNENMPYYENSENEWEITLDKNNFTSLGQYSVAAECNTSTQVGASSYGIEVNKLGDDLTNSQALFYIAILFTVLLLFGFFLTIFLMTPAQNITEMTKLGKAVTKITYGKYIKIISLWIAFGFFMWFLTIISGMATNYIFFSGVKNLISNLLTWLGYLSVGINWAVPMILFWMTWKDIVLNLIIKRTGFALINATK